VNLLQKINTELISGANDENALGQKHFFKEPINTRGWKSGDLHKIAKKYFPKDLPKNEVFQLCNKLWATGFMEESFIVCDWVYELAKKYEEKDFDVFENWIEKYISNWATCDTFCTNIMGEFVEKYPACIEKIKNWAVSNNRWVKRASAVSFIAPAKKGHFAKDIFAIADILLLDPDDLVQKGYGWSLKCLSQSQYLQDVYDFVTQRKDKMPRTAYRYAIEKMPDEMRKNAIKNN
jgi:3-methyladenine DNA glycosylase AlkD